MWGNLSSVIVIVRRSPINIIVHISAPVALPHEVSESITFRGYDLPKGTMILPNLYQSHVDPMIWEVPFSFNPGRWLDENNKIKNNPAFIPFSVGGSYVLLHRLSPRPLPSPPLPSPSPRIPSPSLPSSDATNS